MIATGTTSVLHVVLQVLFITQYLYNYNNIKSTFGIEVVTAQQDTNSIRSSNVGSNSNIRIGSTTKWKEDRLLQQQQSVGKIDQLILYNAFTDQPIITLVDGMVVNITTTTTTATSIGLTVVASITNGSGPVGSVRFGYNSRNNIRTESSAPYSLCGDTYIKKRNTYDYRVCSYLTSVIGQEQQHNVTVTSYSGSNGNGTIGSIQKVSFRVVAVLPSPTTKAPTKIPIRTPTKSPFLTPPPTTTTPPTVSSCNIPKVTTPWQKYGPFYPSNAPEAQAVSIINTNNSHDLVIFGGFSSDFKSVTNHTYARDISIPDQPWRRMDDIPILTGITHAATVVINTKVYVCGGYVGIPPGIHTSLCYIYDHSIPPGTTTGQWSSFVSLPHNGTAGGGMIYDNITKLLFYTGGAQRPKLNSRHAIDVNQTYKVSLSVDPNNTKNWVLSTPIPYHANHQSSVTVLYNGIERHYVSGGQIGEDEKYGNVDDTYEFIPHNETWVLRTPIPYGRGHTTSSTKPYGCGFIMAGGSINSVTNALNRTNDIHYYHIPSNNWTRIGSLQQKGATPKVFVDEINDYIYYTDSKATSRIKLSGK